MNEYLNIDYFKSLDQQPYKELYARLTALTQDELPLETFEGLIATGSLNSDGASSIRRTCSLTVNVASKKQSITDVYWALTHKFKLEIGVRTNDANEANIDIEWFKQGIYVINNFSKNETSSSYNISISGQDKMCTLNGTVGGSFPHEIDFGQIEIEQEDGTVIIDKVLIRDIITQSVNQYGKEPLHNIIINDLPDEGLELLEYRGKTPMYMFIRSEDGINISSIDGFTFDGEIDIITSQYKQIKDINFPDIVGNDHAFTNRDYGKMQTYLNNPPEDLETLNKIDIDRDGIFSQQDLAIAELYINNSANAKVQIYDHLIKLKDIPQYWVMTSVNPQYNQQATPVIYDKIKYYICKLEFGDTIGYRKTPLTYAGELVCKAGENIDTLLKKIQTMLGEFEYFYDLEGHFVFQKKKTYLQELFSPVNGDIIEPLMVNSPYAYTFQNLKLITSIGTNPSINQVKNDFIFWGKKAGALGNQIDIHVRYAIDKKPISYKTSWDRYEKIENLSLMCRGTKIDQNYYLNQATGLVHSINDIKTIYSRDNENGSYTYRPVDYNLLNKTGSFYLNIDKQPKNFTHNNEIIRVVQMLDTSNFIELDLSNVYYKVNNEYKSLILEEQITIKDYTKLLHLRPKESIYNYNDYDWREIIYRMAQDWQDHKQEANFYYEIAKSNPEYINGITGYEQYYADLLAFWRLLYNPNDTIKCFSEGDITQKYWNKQFYTNPETAIFWFDFLDAGSAEISKYSVQKIGMRQKVATANSKSNTSIFYNNTPEVLFIKPNETIKDDLGYTALQLPQNIEKLLAVSSQGTSLIENVNSAIYNNVVISEGITLSIIPIYHLEPNTRIYVEGIGDLIITKISCPLGHNGTMTLTCQKPLPRIY